MTDIGPIIARLRRRGYRDTGPRRAVVEAVSRREGSFTAQELADELAPSGVGRATVFRALSLLDQLGQLSRLHVGEECHRYTRCDETHHHHLVCTDCSLVIPFEACSVEQEAARIAGRLGFDVQGHHVDVFGRCATCATA